MMTISKILPLAFLGAGVFLLFQVFLPLISFRLWEIRNIEKQSLLISPQPSLKDKVLGISVKSQDNFPAFISSLKRENNIPYSQFLLSLPSIGVKEARVLVESNDLLSGLVHLPGSALLGEKGNVFISGHSALPLLADGKNYQAVFSNLNKLKKVDKILVSVEGLKFEYQVMGIKIVDPQDLSVILPPDKQGRYISLMTCVPPGLNTKRLIVLGQII